MFPCWKSLFVCVYLHAPEWLLAVSVTTSGWHSVPVNQAAGKLGGSASNGLLEIIPKLSMNYPTELRHSSQALSIDGNWEEGECWTKTCACAHCQGEIWTEQCCCLCHEFLCV